METTTKTPITSIELETSKRMVAVVKTLCEEQRNLLVEMMSHTRNFPVRMYLYSQMSYSSYVRRMSDELISAIRKNPHLTSVIGFTQWDIRCVKQLIVDFEANLQKFSINWNFLGDRDDRETMAFAEKVLINRLERKFNLVIRKKVEKSCQALICRTADDFLYSIDN